MTSELTLLDMNSALEMSLDEVATAPDFIDPPDGNYILTMIKVSMEEYDYTDEETKEESKRKRLRIIYAVSKTIELSKPEDVVPNGSMFSESFMINENGLSYFKKQAEKTLGKDNIKGVQLKDIMDAMMDGIYFRAQVKVKSTTKGEKTYKNVQVRIQDVVDELPEDSWEKPEAPLA